MENARALDMSLQMAGYLLRMPEYKGILEKENIVTRLTEDSKKMIQCNNASRII